MDTDTKGIQIQAYDYPLPDSRIAKFPLAERDHSKLLVYHHGQITEDIFCALPEYLVKGDLMVFNNSRVIQARLFFRKLTGALIEVFLLEPYEPSDYEQNFQTVGHCSWTCLVGNLKKWKSETLVRTIEVKGLQVEVQATRKDMADGAHVVSFSWTSLTVSFAEIIEVMGELPIPPYLNRKTEESDKSSYQTVYSKIKGSVAAPTAGLHFTQTLLHALDEHGLDREELTLHVGAGTFKPVKSKTISGHEMHTEIISVRRQTVAKLISHGGRAIAVGTTSVRTLESLYYMGVKLLSNPTLSEEQLHVSQWEPYEVVANISVVESLKALLAWYDKNDRSVLHSSTQIIIVPGYQFKIVKALITNFHQPKSTLLLLVSAFVCGNWREIYNYALAHDFRFLSYGDSSLLIP